MVALYFASSKHFLDLAAQLASLQRPFKRDALSRVQLWKEKYTSADFRYKFLVLRGDSRSGKTTLAKSLFPNPFVQTVQNSTVPELRGFDWTYHRMIVFDNVNDDSFVLNWRALMQANNDMHVLGSSSTGMYAYRIWLWGVPIVMTVDLQAKWNSDDGWIRENCVEVVFNEPCYCALDPGSFV